MNKKKDLVVNPKKFKWMEKKRVSYLKNLTIEKSVVMLELLTSKETLNEFRKEDIFHSPLCLKLGLMRQKR